MSSTALLRRAALGPVALVLSLVIASPAVAQKPPAKKPPIKSCGAPKSKKGFGLVDSGKKWNELPGYRGDTVYLQVRFLNGDPILHAKLKRWVKAWEDCAGVVFRFTDAPLAEIRIRFDDSGQSWSLIGTDALEVRDPREHTMQFGWLTADSSDEDDRAVILHEFGHALGFEHEHQNPAGGIKWNRDAVYAHYKKTMKWDEAMVNEQVFKLAESTNYSKFDRHSIMLYRIDPGLTTNGYKTVDNTKLSEMDKLFAAKWYPSKGNADFRASASTVTSFSLSNPTSEAILLRLSGVKVHNRLILAGDTVQFKIEHLPDKPARLGLIQPKAEDVTMYTVKAGWKYHLGKDGGKFILKAEVAGAPQPAKTTEPVGNVTLEVDVTIANQTKFDVAFSTVGTSKQARRIKPKATQTFTFEIDASKGAAVEVNQVSGPPKRYTLKANGSYVLREDASRQIVLQTAAAAAPAPNPAPSPAPSAPDPLGLSLGEGSVVWAEWKPNDWYHGKITRKAGANYLITFDDGDTATLPGSKIALDREPQRPLVREGIRVLAKWTDGKLYPGKVAAVKSGSFAIEFDDGGKLDVTLKDLRLIAK